jgi:hypothetical protein
MERRLELIGWELLTDKIRVKLTTFLLYNEHLEYEDLCLSSLQLDSPSQCMIKGRMTESLAPKLLNILYEETRDNTQNKILRIIKDIENENFRQWRASRIYSEITESYVLDRDDIYTMRGYSVALCIKYVYDFLLGNVLDLSKIRRLSNCIEETLCGILSDDHHDDLKVY